MTPANTLLSLALGGLLAGALTACGGTEAPADPATPPAQPEATAATPATPAEVQQPAKPAEHACKGMNECKAQGGCHVEGKNGCAGMNECKGQGGCCTMADRGQCPSQDAPKTEAPATQEG